ncbi:hypothetical protein LJC31_04010 [Synergistaceae bacterium OttesenSCG-928-I11]|nr:hypothetical protein [Synergistaceae bacterium OttesenSCG-928-I11]
MGMDKIGAANAAFLSDWNEAHANIQKQMQQKPKTSREQAMEAFADAMRNCDKAIENVVDKHHESVAESAKKNAEYRKKVARQEQIQKRAEEQRLFHEERLINQLNLRNMLKERKLEDVERRELFDALG